MQIHYKAIAFHPDTGNLQVLYYNEDLPDGIQFSIEIPKANGRYPSGDALDALIGKHIPFDMFEAARQPGGGPDAFSVPSQTRRQTKPQLFDIGTAFVTEEQEVLFIRRPLLRINGLTIPVDII